MYRTDVIWTNDLSAVARMLRPGALLIVFLFGFLMTSWGCPMLLAAEQSPRSILVLDQSSAGLPFNTAVASTIRSTVNAAAKTPISFYSEHLDANRFFGPGYENDFVQFLKAKYAERQINVVVVLGLAALDFMERRREQLWPSAPVIFAAIDDATMATRALPKNVTGATMQLALLDMVKVARMVMPNLKRVAMVGDPLERQTFYRRFQNEIPAVAAQLEIIDLMDMPLSQLKSRLGDLPEDTVVIYTGIYFTSEGISYVPAELTVQIAEWANRPVVVNVSSYLNKGAVGGYVVQANPIGEHAARIALRILDGESASDIPMVKVPSALIFEWPALQRWKISESTLPPKSEILFRNPSVWEQYRLHITVFLAALILQFALITWLIYEHWRRRTAEAGSLKLTNELAQMNRFATAGEMSASIAHELRQPMAAIASYGSAGLNWLKKQVPDLNEARIALEAVVRESHRADDVIKGVRAMFRPESSARTHINLNELIQDVMTITARQINSNNIVLTVNLTDNPPPVVMADSVQLQQVILNLIMNAADAMSQPGHWARMLQLGTEMRPDGTVLMKVTDSGPSVDPKTVEKMFQHFFTTKPSGMGMGLPICKTIVEAHGGTLTASPSKPHGMEFRIVLPLAKFG